MYVCVCVCVFTHCRADTGTSGFIAKRWLISSSVSALLTLRIAASCVPTLLTLLLTKHSESIVTLTFMCANVMSACVSLCGERVGLSADGAMSAKRLFALMYLIW